MSANTTPTGPSTVPELAERLEDALDRIDELEETVQTQQDTIDELEEEVERADATAHAAVAQLRNANERFETEVGHAAKDRAQINARITELEDPNTGVLGKLHEEIDEERDKRGQEIAMVRRRIGAVADEADVEIDNADLMGDDKIRRAMRDGADAVENTVYSSHERAVELLRNINDVGTRTTDKMGPRFTVDTPSAKEFFRTRNDEKLKSSQIKRVFEKIEDWGADSPRQVNTKFGGSKNKLVIYLETEASR